MATAQDVIDRVRQLANDAPSSFVSSTLWTDAELLDWISDAQREIVKLKPESNPVTAEHEIVDETPRQRIDPDAGYRLIRVESNGEFEV